MALKHVKQKVDSVWSLTKQILVLLCIWGLIFSVTTIGRLRVAFEYDGALVNSSASLQKAKASTLGAAMGSSYWSMANESYDKDTPKLLPYSLAWLFRLCGFQVTIFAMRPDADGEGLKKDWRNLAPGNRFIFVADSGDLRQYLHSGRYLLFFGASDGDISQARQAHVFPLRVRRAVAKAPDYHPGIAGERAIPYSQY